MASNPRPHVVLSQVPVGSVVALYAGVLYRNSSEFFQVVNPCDSWGPSLYGAGAASLPLAPIWTCLQVFKPEDSSAYLMARYDGVIMDGIHGVGDTPEARDMELFGLGEVASPLLGLCHGCHTTPVLQIINHPNEGVSPNVQTAQFKFPSDLAPELALYAPNRFHFERPQGKELYCLTGSQKLMHAVVPCSQAYFLPWHPKSLHYLR